MFNVDWTNSDTLLLNLTNLALGITLAMAVLAVILGLCGDMLEKLRRVPHGGKPARAPLAPSLRQRASAQSRVWTRAWHIHAGSRATRLPGISAR